MMNGFQSGDEDIEIAPAENEQAFAFDPNVQMPSGGFQLWLWLTVGGLFTSIGSLQPRPVENIRGVDENSNRKALLSVHRL